MPRILYHTERHEQRKRATSNCSSWGPRAGASGENHDWSRALKKTRNSRALPYVVNNAFISYFFSTSRFQVYTSRHVCRNIRTNVRRSDLRRANIKSYVVWYDIWLKKNKQLWWDRTFCRNSYLQAVSGLLRSGYEYVCNPIIVRYTLACVWWVKSLTQWLEVLTVVLIVLISIYLQ